MIKVIRYTTYFCFLISFATTCKTTYQPVISKENFPEVINLNNIAMVPHKNYLIPPPEKNKNESVKIDDEPETVKFQKNVKGKYCIVLDLTYRDSGLNIIESIKNGEVLDNKIVIRDAGGKIIGQDSINFQAFTIFKTVVAKVETNEVLTDSGDHISLEEKQKKEKPKYKVEQLNYSDTDKIPQPICLKNDLQSGSYISISVELTYVQPFLRENCHTTQKNCPLMEREVMRGASQHFQKKINEKEAEILENPEKNTRFAFSKEDWEIARKSMKSAIESIELGLKKKELPSATDFGNSFKYREFKLLGAPRYFKVILE